MNQSVFTRSRDEMFSLSRKLISEIEQELFSSDQKLYIVRVNGSWRTSKKIIADASREYFEKNTSLTMGGKFNVDEVWSGTHKGKKFLLGFLNCNDPDIDPYSQTTLNNLSPTERGKLYITNLPEFDKGIVFLQNCPQEVCEANLDIWIEKHPFENTIDEPSRILKKEFVDDFRKESESNEWLRYVEIHSSKKLLNNTEFNFAM